MNLNAQTAQSSSVRTLLLNATACQVLANIATMQLYYSEVSYAFYYYDSNIWDPELIWKPTDIR